MFGGSTVRTIQTVFDVQDRGSEQLQKAEARGDDLANQMEQTEQRLGSVTQAITLTGGAAVGLGAGIAALTARFSRLDEQFATIQATSGATAEQMERIREATKGVSTSLPITLSQSARAAKQLSFAGLSATETMDALSETGKLAAASNLQAGQAAQTVARSLNAFNLEAEQTDAIVGSLSATFANSATNISRLSQGLTEVQATANAAGLSIQETSAALGLLSSSGLAGSKSGTSLNATLRRLTSGSGETQEALNRLGLSMQDFTDSSGDLKGIVPIMSTISERMDGVESQAQQVRIAQQLVGAEGARALLPLIDKTGELSSLVENNLRAELQGAIGDFDEMSGKELERVGTSLGMENLSSDTGATELIANLQQLDEQGESTAEIASRLQVGLGVTGDAAELLAEDITQTDRSASALAESITEVTTAEGLAEAQTQTLSGQITQLRSDLQVIGYQMQQGTKPAVMGVVSGFRSLTTPLAKNEAASKALGAGLVGLTGVLGVATVLLGAHAAQLKLATLAQQGYASSTYAGTAALWAHSAATAAASKAQWLMTASSGQLATALIAKTATLHGEAAALWGSVTATLADASAKGVLTGATVTANAALTAFWSLLGPVGWAVLGLAAAGAALAAVLHFDLFGAGEAAGNMLAWFGDKAGTAWAATKQLMGIIWELTRIGATLTGLGLVAPFVALIKLPGMIRSAIPEAKAAAAELPGQIIAGLNSMGPAKYLLPVIGPVLAIRDGIDRFGPQLKQAAMNLPGSVVAGLNSLGPAKYLLPVIGPLMGLHDLITGVGPQAKQAAAQLPFQIIAGLNSMGRWKYLLPVVGPLFGLHDLITEFGPEAKAAAAELPGQIIAGLSSMGPAKYLLPVLGPVLAIRDGIDRFGPQLRQAAMNLPANIVAGLNSLGPAKYALPLLGPLLLAKDIITNPNEWREAGAEIPDMIASGIADAADAPVDAVAGVVSDVRGYLPFSPADKGPLSTLDQTGPALVSTIADGVESNQGQLTSALQATLGATPLGIAGGAALDVASDAAQSVGGESTNDAGGKRIEITVNNEIVLEGEAGDVAAEVERAAESGTATAFEEFVRRISRELNRGVGAQQ